MKTISLLRTLALVLMVTSTVLHAQVPQLINYQGRVAVGDPPVNFDGSGSFKFALVNEPGNTTYWSNDGTSNAGSEPTAAVNLPVTKGLYSVLLGANMTAIPNSVFDNTDVHLRVWFNDGTHGFEHLEPDQRIAAVGYAMMAGNVPDGAITSSKIANGAVGNSQLAAGAVQAENIATGAVGSAQLANHAVTSANLATGAAAENLKASGQSGVAGGGVILSQESNANDLVAAGYVKIGRLEPTSESWQQRTPTDSLYIRERLHHTAVWTGSEMIIWGGHRSGNTGKRYNPAVNSWTEMSTIGAPGERGFHTAVWTGSEMIVWGGHDINGYLNTGGNYNPAGNWWSEVTTIGAPTARASHTAVWTGSEMIVWGGYNNGMQNTGGRYNPAMNYWTAAVSPTGAPAARYGHTAVWTGTEMIVWGGQDYHTHFDTGGRYNPSGNTWSAVTSTGAPVGRWMHTAVWTGSEMIIWGGETRDWSGNVYLNIGGRYSPAGDSWSAVTTAGAPEERGFHTAVWTGSEMIVWGGQYFGLGLNSGGRYSPSTNAWLTSIADMYPYPVIARLGHTAVWTGSEMIVWGGNDGTANLSQGFRFDPVANTVTQLGVTGAPAARAWHTAVWTGSEMIVWGGANGGVLNTGGRYSPAGNSWSAVSMTGVPAARYEHTAVWTGSQMIIWGGSNGGFFNDGARYTPTTNTWEGLASSGGPAIRTRHTAVWTGSEMIVWGGLGASAPRNDGGSYNPSANTWSSMTTSGAPSGRWIHTAVWTGSEMVIWGGYGNTGYVNTGARYHPVGDTWTALPTTGAPSARRNHSAVWTGSEMIVWGGEDAGGFLGGLAAGASWNLRLDTWTALSSWGGPSASAGHTALWTGDDMLVFGGSVQGGVTDTIFAYVPPRRQLYLYMKP